MASTSTDVREWLREQGLTPPARGRVPAPMQARYDAAHADAGVTAADFPPDGGGDDGGEPAAAAAKPSAAADGSGERRPRTVKGGGATTGRTGWRGLFSRGGGGGQDRKKGGRRAPRTSLADFAEETWQDAAWFFAGMPPVARILGYQAPYAGVVFDQAVSGTPVDRVCQPLARHAESYRALNGLIGPPVLTALILAEGRWVTNEQGQMLIDSQTGRPFPDGRTAVLMGMLRYSCMQMAKVSDIHADEIDARTAKTEERAAAVDALIDSIFGWHPPAGPNAPPPGAAPPPREQPPGGGALVPTMIYPPAPQMDATGADPKRMGAPAPAQ
jgi:hypothetical protein